MTDDQTIYAGKPYNNLKELMQPYRDEIVSAGGRCLWYPTNKLYGNSNTSQYVLARSLNSEISKNVAILYLVVGDQMIDEAFRQLKAENSMSYLAAADGTVLYASNEEQYGTVLELDCIGTEQDFTGAVPQFSGRKALVTSVYIPEANWYCVSAIYQSDILSSFSNLLGLFVTISAVYILFLLIMLYLLRRYIFLPLGTLKTSMDDYARTELAPASMENIGVGELHSLSEHFNSMTRRIADLMTEYREKVDEINRQKMKTLAAQLTPHFVYNALNTIKWVAVLNQQKKIQELVESLIYIFMNAARAEDSSYSVRDELELVKNYAVLQKARFMNFELVVEHDEASMNCKFRKLLLQPMVENAIVHGLARGGVRNTVIKLRAWVEDGTLHLVLEDKGVGFDVEAWRKHPKTEKSHTNIGIHNVEQIIALEYGEPYHMEIQSAPGEGTTVHYVLPALCVKKEGAE